MIKTHECYYPLYNDKEHFIILVTGGRGSGKCLKKDTLVMMADLTIKPIQEIKVGEKVMGDDGTPRNVIQTSKGFGDLYKVSQNNAEDYVVNEHHILTLRKRPSCFQDKGNLTKAGVYRRPNGRYPQYAEICDIPIMEYMQKSERFKNCFYGVKSKSIPYKESKVEIPPYLLGLWLGDGTSTLPNITNPEPEIKDYIEEYCKNNGLRVSGEYKQGAYHLRIVSCGGKEGANTFLNQLRRYNLVGHKHIPQCYISNSENVRLELLAGILDTDGHFDPTGDYEVVQKSKELAKQIKLLADTLGFRTKFAQKKGTIDGAVKGTYYRVYISGDVNRIPCKVERKKSTGSYYEHRSHLTSKLTITKEPEQGEWYGIGIDGNNRYLLADGTITHNSYSVGTFIERMMFERYKLDDVKKIVHNILYTRYTMTSASISVIPEFLEKVEADGTSQYFHTTKTDVTNTLTGAKVMFRGIKTSSGNQTAKLKSIQGITTFVCDEAEEWTSEKEFETIMFSIRQKGIQNRIIIIMNPTDSNHFIYQKYIKDTHKLVEFDGVPVQISTHPNVLHIHTSYLNNLEHLSEEFIKEAQAMKESEPERYAHIFMGQWADVAEGAVFKKWGIVDEFPKECKKVALAIDWGYTHDPTSILRCGIIGNRLYIDEEHYETGLLSSDIIKRIRVINERDGKNYKVIADSADPRLIQEVANGGILIYPVMKGPGSVVAGIDKMNTMEIFVTKKSVHVQEELRNYTWDKDKDGNFINQPIDAYNHCFTADTMIITADGEKPIIEVKVGDLVLTSNGYRKVTKFFDNGVKEVCDYYFAFNECSVKLTATPEHRIKTENGWKEISTLTEEDTIYLCKSSMGKNTAFTKENDISLAAQRDCTLLCGNTITEKYLKGITFTILTAIRTITQSVISKPYQVQSILGCTARSIVKMKRCLHRCENKWRMRHHSRRTGINLQKVVSGIGSTDSKEPITTTFVSNAEKHSLQQINTQNSVPTLASQRHDAQGGVTMKHEPALCVENLSLSESISKKNAVARNAEQNLCQYVQKTRLQAIRHSESRLSNVYDIEVEEMHEFFANGVLVHNCIDASRYYVLGELLGKIMMPKRIDTSRLGIF